MGIVIVPSHWDGKNYSQGRDSQPGLEFREGFLGGLCLIALDSGSESTRKNTGRVLTGRAGLEPRLEVEAKSFKLRLEGVEVRLGALA